MGYPSQHTDAEFEAVDKERYELRALVRKLEYALNEIREAAAQGELVDSPELVEYIDRVLK